MTIIDRLGVLSKDASSHIGVLTGLRGWAALWVYFYHLWVFAGPRPLIVEMGGVSLNLTPFMSVGGAGVSIFFVLSGFLLALPFAEWQLGQRARPALGRYLFRRVLRVFPAYYVQLAILLFLAYQANDPRAQDLAAIGGHLLMWFVPLPGGATPLNGVWWTLPIEFSFYLALPLLAWALSTSRWWMLCAGSLLLMIGWRHLVVVLLADAPIPERVVVSYQLPGSLDMFSIGMLAALVHVNRSRLPAWLLPSAGSCRLGVLGLILLIVDIYWLHYDGARYWADNPIFYLWTPTLSLAIAAVILSGIGGGRLVKALFANRAMVLVGLCSYSVYLWHIPLLNWITTTESYAAITGYRMPWLLMISLPATLGVGFLSYVLIERPFMHLRRSTRES